MRTLLAAAAYAASALIMWGGVEVGIVDATLASWHTPLLLVGPLLFFGAQRSGWSQRFHDPTLTMAQMMVAKINLCIAYAINAPVRSVTLVCVALVMAFGMFSLKAEQIKRLGLFTLFIYGATMSALALLWPAIYPPQVEFINFLVLATVVPTVTALSAQVARLRAKRREQRVALQRALTDIEQLASHDPLTGLVNRRFMTTRLAHERERMQVEPSPVCLCLIDLDHFKRINDVHGHAAGDETLRRFARTFVAGLRDIDLLSRWGGEEFLLLLPGTDAEAACQVMDRLRLALAQAAHWEDMPALRVTFSAGVARWNVGESIEQAVERADNAAYLAKTAGRDRCCCAAVVPVAPVATA